MQPNPCPTDPILLSQYTDGELKSDQAEQIRRHLSQCPDCRRQVELNHRLASRLNTVIDQRTAMIDSDALEFETLARMSCQNDNLRNKIRRFLSPGKALIPASVVVCVLFLLLFLTYRFIDQDAGQPVQRAPVQTAAAPSAIIDSFSGEASAVMIMETPHSRETILWYNENV